MAFAQRVRTAPIPAPHVGSHVAQGFPAVVRPGSDRKSLGHFLFANNTRSSFVYPLLETYIPQSFQTRLHTKAPISTQNASDCHLESQRLPIHHQRHQWDQRHDPESNCARFPPYWNSRSLSIPRLVVCQCDRPRSSPRRPQLPPASNRILSRQRLPRLGCRWQRSIPRLPLRIQRCQSRPLPSGASQGIVRTGFEIDVEQPSILQ